MSSQIKLDFGFLSPRWKGLKTLEDLNGTRWKYSGAYVDVVDLKTRKKIGRMVLRVVVTKFK